MLDATVIIAAWCAERTLGRAIGSALAQDSVKLEIIVVDDASPDGTVQVARAAAAADPRVRVLQQTTNGGPSKARNAGLAAARGRWAAVLDADDAFAPSRLDRMIRLGDLQGADAVYDDFHAVDTDGRALGDSHLAPLARRHPECWDLQTFLAGCQAEPGKPGLGYLKPILRMDFLRAHELHYDENLRNGEDFHLMAALLAAGGKLWITPEPGYRYTVAAGSISNRLHPDHARALSIADAAFIERHMAILTPREKYFMLRRMRRLCDLNTAEIFLQSLRAGHVGKAARALLGRPRATGRLLRQIWAAARQRLG